MYLMSNFGACVPLEPQANVMKEQWGVLQTKLNEMQVGSAHFWQALFCCECVATSKLNTKFLRIQIHYV